MLKKLITNKWLDLFIITTASIFYLLTHLYNLTIFPIYLDESIYITWAKLFSINEGFAYIPLNDGKTPLFMWIVAKVFPLFEDPLFAGRLVSVLAGLGTMICLWVVTRILLGKRTGFFFLIFYSLLPFGFLMERLAFIDSLLVFWVSLSFMFLVLSFLPKDNLVGIGKSIFLGLLAGVFLGLAYYTKSSTRMFFFISLLISFSWLITNKITLKQIIKITLGTGIFSITYFQMIDILKIAASRYWMAIAEKENDFIFTLKDFQTRPFNPPYLEHSQLLAEYFVNYITVPIFIFALVGLFMVLRKQNRKAIPFTFTALSIVFGILIFAKIFTSRYIFPASPAITVLAAFGFAIVSKKISFNKTLIILLLTLSIPILTDFNFLTNPPRALMASDDRSSLLCGEVSGYGIKETVSYLKPIIKKSPVTLMVDSQWGIPEAFNLYLKDCKNCQNFSLRTLGNTETVIKDLQNNAQTRPTYIFLGTNNLEKFNPLAKNNYNNLNLIFSGKKQDCPNEKSIPYYLFEVLKKSKVIK